MSLLQSSSLMRLHSTAGFRTAWGNLCVPPLQFRRRPPQSNYPPDTVQRPDYGASLGTWTNKGGISTLPPSILAYRVHRLPPMLHMQAQIPMSSYSKGAQGLSVFLRVHGIFTATSISPSLWPRQCGDRYAIRAGRNLPDKEFRYLRTVIVTAAVYRGFNSELRLRWLLLLTFRHRAGVSPYTSSLRLRTDLCF